MGGFGGGFWGGLITSCVLRLVTRCAHGRLTSGGGSGGGFGGGVLVRSNNFLSFASSNVVKTLLLRCSAHGIVTSSRRRCCDAVRMLL